MPLTLLRWFPSPSVLTLLWRLPAATRCTGATRRRLWLRRWRRFVGGWLGAPSRAWGRGEGSGWRIEQHVEKIDLDLRSSSMLERSGSRLATCCAHLGFVGGSTGGSNSRIWQTSNMFLRTSWACRQVEAASHHPRAEGAVVLQPWRALRGRRRERPAEALLHPALRRPVRAAREREQEGG